MSAPQRNTTVPVELSVQGPTVVSAPCRDAAPKGATRHCKYKMNYNSHANNATSIKNKKKLFTSSCNVRTLSEEAHLCNFTEIENINWHIVGLSGVGRKGELLFDLSDKHVLP